MKKLFCVLLVSLLLTGCTQSEQPAVTTTTAAPTTAPTVASPEPDIPEPVKSAQIEVLSCCFREEVLPADFEAALERFPVEEGKLYVDLAFRVTNTGEAPLGEEDFYASFEFDGSQIEMQLEVEEDAWHFANEDPTVYPGQTRMAHLLYNVDRAAANAPLTVHYSLLEETGELSVEPETPPTLEDKTQLKLGETVNLESFGSVQVVDCLIQSYLRATGNGAEKYYFPNGGEMLILVLKTTSETAPEPDLLDAYLMAGEIPEYSQIYVESEDHLDLIPLEDAPAPQVGEERILHIWVEIPFGLPKDNISIRLTLDTNCYYCYPFG